MLARFRLVLVLALALVLALPALAIAAAPDKAEKVAAKMLDFDKALAQASAQLDATLAAMNALAQPGDLSAKYKTFTKEVDKLQKVSEKAKSNSAAATSQREQYLAQWKASQDKIQNEQLKAASEARRAELEPKVEAIKTSLGSAREAFGPFMQDLKDLTIFLANQLNPSGIAAASELMGKCNESGAKVKADIATGSTAVRDLAGSIQPGGPAPAKK